MFLSFRTSETISENVDRGLVLQHNATELEASSV